MSLFRSNSCQSAAACARITAVSYSVCSHAPTCFNQATGAIDTSYCLTIYAHIMTFFQWMDIDSGALLYGLDHVDQSSNKIMSIQSPNLQNQNKKSHKSTQKTKIHRKIFARFGYYAYLCSVHSRQPLNFKLSGVFVYSDMVKDNKQCLLVRLLALSPWAAIYSAIIAVSCLELKDKLHGCPWDQLDWACTVLGGFITMLFWLIV